MQPNKEANKLNASPDSSTTPEFNYYVIFLLFLVYFYFIRMKDFYWPYNKDQPGEVLLEDEMMKGMEDNDLFGLSYKAGH